MTEKERQKRLRGLRKRLKELHQAVADEANSSRAVQANVRESIDICEKEIHSYENMIIDTQALEIVLKSPSGEEKKFYVVENTPDPFNNRISNKSIVGKKLSKANKGQKIKIGLVEFEILSANQVEI